MKGSCQVRYAENEARRKTLQKQFIVTAAAELFLENGVENVSMVQIAEKGDVGVATLYRYFSTKTNLLLDVGAMLWEDLLRLFDGIFATDGYRDKPGIDQIGELLSFFLMLYREHSGFVRFVQELDAYLLREKPEAEKLREYEQSIMNIYPLFAAAYEKACAEGTAKPGLDAKLLYSAVSHALTSTSQKFLAGDVLPGDAACDKYAELQMLTDVILSYIKIS